MQLLGTQIVQGVCRHKSCCLGLSTIYFHVKTEAILVRMFYRDLSICGFREESYNLASTLPWEETHACRHEANVKLANDTQNSFMDQMMKGHIRSWDMVSTAEILTFIDNMTEPPSIEDFIYILQKCRKERNLRHLHEIHAHLCKHGLENSEILGNILVELCLDCKSLTDSQRMFARLLYPNEDTWAALMQGYNDHGDFENALNLLILMYKNCSHHCKYNHAVALRACAGGKHPKLAQQIHMEVVKDDLHNEPLIINSIVGSYSKCGLLPEAWKVFQSLLIPSPVSWTALMSGYAEHGVDENALHCLDQMLVEGLHPNVFTLACGLRICASVGALQKGQLIHCVIAVQDEFQRDLFVVNALVDMYIKCRELNAAENAFNLLGARDAVTWTSIISGFADCGFGQRAADYLEQMQAKGIYMNAMTLASSLKAYASMGIPEKGQILHAKIVKEGFTLDQVVGNALIDMYTKFGLLLDAQGVFESLLVRNTISWNILIAGFCEQGFGEGALLVLQRLILECACMDATTYISSLKACGSLKDFCKGCLLHFMSAEQGLDVDPFIGNSLIDMYAKCYAWSEALHVFAHLPLRSIVSWTACIAVYLAQGLAKEALAALEMMQKDFVSPDEVTHMYGLQACGIIESLTDGQAIYSQIVKQGFDSVIGVVNTVVHMYDKCHSLIDAYFLFVKLPSRTAPSWSALIAGYTENDLCGEALMVFEYMKQDGWSPNAAAFASTLRACGTLGAAKKGHELHIEIIKNGLTPNTHLDPDEQAERAGSVIVIGNVLIDMYAKCNDMASAQYVFDRMSKLDLETWNALMVGYTRIGEDELVFNFFSRLNAEGILLNGVTFLCLLTACSHAGFVQKGEICYLSMHTKFDILATIEHHNCLIDLLGRAGQLSYAIKLLEEMPSQPNMSSWNTILAGCRKLGNVELARRALECAMRLDHNHAAAFIAMYNIFADANMWTDAKHIKSIHRRPRAG